MSNVHIITQGCSANLADSELMAGQLEQQGHVIVKTREDADIIVYNTCTVKSPTVSSFERTLHNLSKKYPEKEVVLAGCIPQAEKNPQKRFEGYSLLGTYQVDRIGEVVERTLQGERVIHLKREHKPRLELPSLRTNSRVEIIPISQGCLNSCTYCKTKHARGVLYSYDQKTIIRRISKAVRSGAYEIWLTSQDNSVYGYDQDTNLAKLLKEIATIPRDFRVRVGMANPKYILDYLPELIQACRHPKIYKFLHVPVQAGNDTVLRDMRRGYTVQDYRKIVQEFRKAIPEITLSTDIICGFPTETRSQFRDTLQLMKETKPDIINISRFWPRPGTIAAAMKPLPGGEVKNRSRILTKLFKELAIENNRKWVGWQGWITIMEKGKRETMLGRNDAYKQVVIPGTQILLGRMLEVKINDCTPFDLRGVVIEKIKRTLKN